MAQTEAFRIVKDAVGDDGQVNQTSILDGLSKVDPKLREKVEPVVYKLTTEREQAYAADTKRISNAAFTFYNAKGWGEFQKSGLSTELNYRNPELYDKLKNESFRKWKESKADGAAARRQQAADNKIALQGYLSQPLEERAKVDVDQDFFGSGADELGLGAIRVQQQKDKAALQKSGAVNSTSFVTGAMADAEGFLPDPGNNARTKAAAKLAREEFKAAAERAYVEFATDPKHERPPSSEEAADIRSKLIRGMQPNAAHPETIERAAAAIVRGVGKPSKVTGTGIIKTDKNGVRWERMSDGSARQLP